MIDESELEGRISLLVGGFPRFLQALGYGSGPGTHWETIERRRQLGSASAAAQDAQFLGLLLSTLGEWGIGIRGSKLVDEDSIGDILGQSAPLLEQLETSRIDDISLDVPGVSVQLHELYWAVADIVSSSAKWVAVTKTIHHLLPDLVVPVDGTFTAGFFRGSTDLPKMTVEHVEKFLRHFREIATRARAREYVRPSSWHSSVTKVVDNAIIGYWRLLLRPFNVPEIQARLRRFAADRDWGRYHSPKNLAMALAGEAGELLEVFQWLTEEESLSLPDEALGAAAEEIADLQIYLLRLADVLGISLTQSVYDKIASNEEKYPVNLSRGNATKYDRRG